MWEEATSKARKAPTSTKWIDHVKKDDNGQVFVGSRLAAHDLQPIREGLRGRLVCGGATAEGEETITAQVAGVRENRREQGQHQVKLVFTDVKKAHLNATCDEEERVELPNEFKRFRRTTPV